MRYALVAMVLIVYALHQDFWNWSVSDPKIFGVLPIGLAYHAGYSIMCAGMMWVLVKFAWPEHLEQQEAEAQAKGPNEGGH